MNSSNFSWPPDCNADIIVTMTYRGKVQGGVVLPIGSEPFPEGAEVDVVPVSSPSNARNVKDEETLGDLLGEFVGKVEGLPPDAAKNHDHYLYGTPKRDD